jgi:hypothetical protein
LKEWFRKSVATAEELDYSDALDWFGIRFVSICGSGWLATL